MAANHLPMFSQSPTVKKKNIPQTMSPTAPGARDSMLSIHSAGLSPPASDAQMSSPLASKTSSTWGKVADEPKSNSCISPQSGVVPSDSIIRSSLAQQLTRDICLSEGGSSSDEASYLGRHFLSQENLQAETSADGAWHTLAESLVGDSPLDSASAEEDPEMTLKARRCSGQMKRAVDQYSPMAKRSRSMPEMATLSLRFPLFSSPPSFSCTPSVTPSPPFYRCRYQWGGPSTYGMHCVRQNSLQGEFVEPGEAQDVADVKFRPSLPRRVKQYPYNISSSVGLVDSHCHLDFLFRKMSHVGSFALFRQRYQSTFPDCYEGCVAVFCDPSTFNIPTVWQEVLEEDGVWATFGCHPHMAKHYTEETDENLIQALRHRKVVALGEIGLDYSHKNFCHHELQKSVFVRQIRLAVEHTLPLVIHSRDATPDTISLLKDGIPLNYPVHRHCFTGNWEEAKEWLDTFPNLCLGLTPLVAFPDALHLQEVARQIPLDRLLIETDAPYFLPKKDTGGQLRHSHPGMAIHVATKVSALRRISVDNVLEAVRENTRRIYGI